MALRPRSHSATGRGPGCSCWGPTVILSDFPRQGQYARDANAYRAADLTVERIGDLVTYDLSELLSLEVLR